MAFRTSRMLGAACALALACLAPAAAQAEAGETPTTLSAIPGVLAADARWQIAWRGPMTADGMTTLPDGSLLFAQEQSNAVWKLWPDGQAFIAWPYVIGAGAVSVAKDGSVLAVERGCTDPGLGKGVTCSLPSQVVELAPERRVIAASFADGSSLGRLNDLIADNHGGAFFTQGALYHVAADGTVTTVAKVESFTNGLALSPAGNTLYVTDRTRLWAFDVAADGATSNRRLFATLDKDTAGFGGDGMAVDAAGRLYVTGDAGIYVFSPAGKELGIIPVPRRAITLAFAGPDRATLYVGAMGAVDPAGQPWTTPDGVRNVAMTIYRLPLLAKGQ